MAGHSIDDRKFRELHGDAVLPPLPPLVATGSLVAVRAARWRVGPCIDHADCRELHLRGMDGAGCVLLWPFDRPIAAGSTPRLRVVSLPAWARHAGRVLSNTIDPRTPRGAFTGDVLAYQLAPAIAVASGVPRVLLADEVGLGKTIQAGWILADLLAREPGARALIAVPASLREQWASELETMFAIAAARVDAAWLRSAVADRPADVSPWAAPGAYLGSIDFLKRPDVARSLTDVAWDLLVIDEAHGATAPTERHAALAAMAAVSRRVVVITATPYSGDAAGFASMVALGACPGDAPPLMFRRSRGEVGDGRTRRHRFATVRIGRDEFRLQRLLERYTRDVWRDAPGDADGARLAMTVLRKRALSSPAAALRSLSRRLELLDGAVAPPRQLSLFDEPPEADDALPDGALATPGLADGRVERRWLAALVDAATRAAGTDSKLRLLLRLIARVAGEPIIVFTEYRDTLRRLAESLPSALHLHGGLTSGERADVQRRFNEHGGILLATDAAADGLNLQRRCRLLVNYELPWNPARLEQRIGRVDRIGQRRTVHAISLVARDTAEDLVVAALARRLARIAATLGERDRLAAFLTEARTARSVIAGTSPGLADDIPPAPPLPRSSPGDYPVERIAAQRRTRVAPATPDTLVADLRYAGLPPGCIALVKTAAVTDRGVVADDRRLLHLIDPTCAKPRRHRDARETARSAVEAVTRAAAEIPEIRDWFADVVRVHTAAVSARIARENGLRRGAGPPDEVQPGLFDGRALQERAQQLDSEARRVRDHERHLEALAGQIDLRLESAIAAVLIVWR